MNWQTLPYLIPYLVSVTISTAVGIYVWHRRATAGATPFALMTLAQASWTLGYVFELASPSLEAKIFWDDIQWVGAFVYPLASWAFALQYTGRKLAHPKRTWGLLAIVPAIFTLLVFTDDLHGLIRPAAWLVPGEPFSALVYDFTAPVWVMTIWAYGLLLSGISMLIAHLVRSGRPFRAQSVTIIVGALIPLIGAALTLVGITLTFHRDTTPLTFAISALVIAWGLFRYRLFDIVPVAREAVVESMSDAVVVVDAHSRLVGLNPAAQELVGHTASRVIGQPVAQVFANWPDLVEQFQDKEEAHIEIVVGAGEGQRHFDLRLSPLRDRRGRLTGRMAVVRDITGRVRAEEALRTSEQRYQMATQAAKVGVWDWNLQSGEFYLDPNVKALLGYSDEEIPNDIEVWTTYVHPDDKQPVMEAAQAHIEGRTPEYVYEHRMQHKDGSVRWISVRGKAIRDAQGNTIRLIGTDTDITERKRAEEALRESEEKFRSLAERSPHQIFINKKGRIVYANERCEEMMGYTREEFYSPDFDFLTLIAPKDRDLVKASFGRHTTGEDVPPYDYALVTKEGKRIDVMLESRLIWYEGERAILGTVTDISERKQAEEALHRRVAELAILNRIAQIVATVTDLPAALETVAETVAHLFDASATVITVLEADQMKVLTQFGHEHMFPETPGQVFPLPNVSAIKQALDQGQAFVIPDAQTNPLPSALREHVRARNIHAVMIVPLRARGAVIGMMGVGTDQADRVFSPAEVALAETIAGAIASAIENVRLYEQAQVVAADAERQRLARELHDSVTQSLYSMTLLANGWGTMAKQGRLKDATDCFTRIGDVGQQTLKEMRLLIYQLRPPILEEVGLVGALQQRLDSVEQRVSVETRLLTEGEVDQIPHVVEEQLFHIAQEALNNALWHAGATAIAVRIQAQESRVVLSVEDNGMGFDPAAPSAGMGLGTMRERAEAIGGEMSITSAPQQGTTVEVTVAIEPDEGYN